MVRLLPLLLLGFVSVLPLRGQSAPLPKTFDLKVIDAYIAGQMKEKKLVGLSVAYMRDGKIVFAKGYGLRSIEKKLPVEADTSFAVGSITKQFTCACIFLLSEEGKLSIDDPVAKFFPKLTRAKDITVRDLMNHTSGYPDYYPLDFLDRRMLKPIRFAEMCRDYAGGKLDFEPGTRFSYSNTGYNILGGIVEQLSGQTFGEFLSRRILTPLQLKHSRFATSKDLPLAASGYTSFALGDPEPATPEADGWIDAAGALWASASDLLRWDLALVEGRVLKPESFREMTASRVLKNGKISDYGAGLGIGTINGDRVLRHTGGVSGFVSGNVFLPRTKSGVVVLSNAEHVSATKLRADLLDLLVADIQTREAPAVPKIAGPTPKEAVVGFVKQLIDGKVDRTQLGEEFRIYLTDEKVKSGGARLKALGEITKVEVSPPSERGGMEVAQVKLTFKTARVIGSLYRSTDGKIQQLLFYPE
jgi:D-alanyl-D-alanine carboxypeptidase